jgi:hypothetical protein
VIAVSTILALQQNHGSTIMTGNTESDRLIAAGRHKIILSSVLGIPALLVLATVVGQYTGQVHMEETLLGPGKQPPRDFNANVGVAGACVSGILLLNWAIMAGYGILLIRRGKKLQSQSS